MPLSDYFTSPTSLRSREVLASLAARDQIPFADTAVSLLNNEAPLHSGHPNFGYLTLLVFEAVLEVVCVSLPGYIVARTGMFDAESQKFLANLNVQLFTPCLIFTKLASQLTAEKLVDLAIIPVIFLVQTVVSYVCAWAIAKLLRFKKRQSNFLIAMGVFGNSNSLPISLVISLSKTLKGLHWDKVPGDNDNEVGARGILYLLIFQQLGQLLRWSWGYNVLLAPPEAYTEEEGGIKKVDNIERGRGEYRDDPSDDEHQRLISPDYSDDRDSDDFDDDITRVATSPTMTSSGTKTPRTPKGHSAAHSPRDTSVAATPANGMVAPNHHLSTPAWTKPDPKKYDEEVGGVEGEINRIRNQIRGHLSRAGEKTSSGFNAAFDKLPGPVQKALSAISRATRRFFGGLWEFMNPPLWAMLIAIVVASIPPVQHAFFDQGTFLKNSVSRAVEQSGGVAVPLILVVLGGNLARNTLPKDPASQIDDPKEERRLLIASLVSRMLLPTIIMAPFIALMAKYVPVSIVDDKIFVIVCFLLTGAPTALQLAQICQINNVYMPVMAKILFQSYVVWILPSTLILVLLALQTVDWATR
jgi:auxin efflux carrier family protein